MKKTILLTLLIAFTFTTAHSQKWKNAINKAKEKVSSVKGNETEEPNTETETFVPTIDDMVLDIEIYSNAQRTEKLSNLKIQENSKIYCRANLSEYIEKLGYYMAGKDYKIFILLEHLERGKSGELSNNENIIYESKGKLANHNSFMEYQKENKFFDFVVDFSDENAANAFQRKIFYKTIKDGIFKSSITINSGMDYSKPMSVGYLEIDFVDLANKQEQNQKAKKAESMKVQFPDAAFTDKNLENSIINSLKSRSDITKVYKVIFTDSKQISRNPNGTPKLRWCNANAWVKLDDGKCYVLIVKVYEDAVGNSFKFDGNPKTNLGHEVH